MKIHKILFLALLFGLINPILIFASDNVIVVKKNAYVYGESNVFHFAGEPNQWNPQKTLSHIDQFEALTSIVKSYPNSDEIDWIYFELENPDSIDIWMNIGTEKANKIKVFKLNDNNQVTDSLLSGLDGGIDYRVSGEFKFWLPLLNRDSRKGTFLIGFHSKTGMHEFLTVFGGKDQLYSEAIKGKSYTMIFFGVMLVMFIYNLFLGIILRDRIYFYYTLNLVALFFLVTFSSHYPFISILLGESATTDYFVLWTWIPIVTLALFTIKLFDLKKESKRMYDLLIVLVLIVLVNAFCAIFIPMHYSAAIFLVLIAVFYLTCAVIGFLLLRKGHPLAGSYFISWLFFWIGGFLWIMVTEWGIFYHDICYYVNYITVSLEVVFFSQALGKRYQLISENHQKSSELLEIKNKELLLMNESMDSFNYHVSHDLKSVLVNAGSLSNMIGKYIDKDDKEKVIKINNKLDEVIIKGQDTIKGFLSLGKVLNTSDQKIHRILVSDKIQDLVQLNDLNKLEVTFLENEFNFLKMNVTSFESIFLNLLTNSAKYCIKKPEVNISLKKDKKQVTIVYSDNGIGIDLDKHGNDIFSPFKRIENNLSEEGTGVGLYLVKKLILDSGGSITPSSNTGEGLTFTISLPLGMIYEG